MNNNPLFTWGKLSFLRSIFTPHHISAKYSNFTKRSRTFGDLPTKQTDSRLRLFVYIKSLAAAASDAVSRCDGDVSMSASQGRHTGQWGLQSCFSLSPSNNLTRNVRPCGEMEWNSGPPGSHCDCRTGFFFSPSAGRADQMGPYLQKKTFRSATGCWWNGKRSKSRLTIWF